MIAILTDSACVIPGNLVELLYRKFFEQAGGGKILRTAGVLGDVPAETVALAERIRAEYNPIKLVMNISGPRALALCGFCDN